MIRRLGVLALALLLAAACAAAPAAPDRGPGASAPADVELDREAQVRRTVDEAVADARDVVAAVRAAQDSAQQTSRHMLEGLDRATTEEGHDLAEQVRELRDRALATLVDADEISERVDAFEDEAHQLLAQGSDPEHATDQAEVLERLELDARALAVVLAPVVRTSDEVVRDVALLSATVEDYTRDNALAGPAAPAAPAPVPTPDEPQPVAAELVAEVTTSKGTLVLELFPEAAPRHVDNFFELVRRGFYDGLTFHRIVPGFVVHGGCPRGDGMGGPGWQLKREFNELPHRRGTLSMARMAHPDSAGSQFFLALDEWPDLDGKYTVFGRMLKGEDTLAAIEATGTVSGVPVEPVTIERIELRKRRPGDES